MTGLATFYVHLLREGHGQRASVRASLAAILLPVSCWVGVALVASIFFKI